MGSSGSGNFSDYSQSPSIGNQGGSSNDDNCGRAFSTRLEEVERCDYFSNRGALPAVGETFVLEHRARICAVSTSGEVIGYLPTTHNYIARCLAAGFNYSGRVSNTRTAPIATVTIDVAPI